MYLCINLLSQSEAYQEKLKGQFWCGLVEKDFLENQVSTDVHAPMAIRATVPMQNSPGFAHAYSCRRGTEMNPEEKCDFWSFHEAKEGDSCVTIPRSLDRRFNVKSKECSV